MAKSKIIAAVEIGTSKVSVLIGDIVNGKTLNIIGMGQCSSRGVIKGDILDFKTASDCTHAAIIAAEKQAGTSVEGVYLALSGGHIEGFYNEANINVTTADNTVSRRDIETVCHLAKSKDLPPERTVIHHIRRPFKLDGRLVEDPEYLEGRRLEVGYWTVHGELAKVSDSIHIINGFNLRVDDLILAGLASGAMAVEEAERKNGVLVIDIGSGVTDFVLYQEGWVETTGSLPLGGDHLTNDLSVGLRVNHAQAEKIKLKHGRSEVRPEDKGEKVWLHGDCSIGDRQLPCQAINRILSLRVEEIFQLVKSRLGSSFRPEKLGGGVVLTGGTSCLEDIGETASRVFGTAVRRAEGPAWMNGDLRGPENLTVLGLLHYGLNNKPELRTEPSRKRNLLAKIFNRE